VRTDLEVIDEAITLIEKDGGWCQGAFCKDAAGNPLMYQNGAWLKLNGSAVTRGVPYAFCVEGAIEHAAGVDTAIYDMAISDDRWRQVRRLNWMVCKVVGKEFSLPRAFNDAASTTQEDAVLALKQVRALIEEG
jgi:hypothetical protein